MKTATVVTFVSALVLCIECHGLERPNKCLVGGKHKSTPSPENSLFACQEYKDNSCCSSEFTKQLATSPIRKIGNFSWTPCNNILSRKCEAYMVMVECFYRCSPNAIFWENPQYPSAIINAPVCSNFCDNWFEACKDDLTCAKNWLTDFNFTTGLNTCQTPCRNFSEYFANGKDMCEGKWGATFEYKETDCLQLNFTGPNPNYKLVEKLFGEKGQPESGAFVFSVDLFVVYISALLYVFLF